jgi:hypothetical protein
MTRALALAVAAVLLAPATAVADGLPVVGLDGRAGVVSRDGVFRYVSFVSGRNTVVARLYTRDGTVARYRTIPGAFSIPAVAYDSSPSGLSADGRTLVLIRPRTQLAQKRTQLAIVDARRLLVRRTIVLRGDFSFDAVSPDGSELFLINYLSLSRRNFDPTRYKVRALDATTGRLAPAPIVDPNDPEEMGGVPVTRATSADGRWAYTLYQGSEHPFVHALDTVGRAARCIDLDALAKRDDLFQMKLRLAAGGRQLQVVKGSKPTLLVDTRSFQVSRPPASAPHPVRNAPAARDDGRPSWLLAFPIALLILVAAASVKPLARATRAR